MIVSAMVRQRALQRPLPALIFRPTCGLLGIQRCNFSRKASLDDTMENIDDIFKQMNQDLAAKADNQSTDVLQPRVVSQKEDVVYIKNPASDWSFNRILHFAN